MTNEKKGFIFYFDNYPLLSALPMEQRGLLFSSLMVYADRVWRDTSVTLEEIMDGFPKLSQTWLNKREYRQQNRQRTQASGTDQVNRRGREDIERTRKLLEQMKRDV